MKKQVRLDENPGCKGCSKDCQWKHSKTLPEIAKRIDRKYNCNSGRKQ